MERNARGGGRSGRCTACHDDVAIAMGEVGGYEVIGKIRRLEKGGLLNAIGGIYGLGGCPTL